MEEPTQEYCGTATLDSVEQDNPTSVRENIGRWSSVEHDLFLKGLEKYGRDWKAIASDIPTRNVVQVRTHAQKYFQKLASSTNSRTVLSTIRRKPKEASHASRTEEIEKQETIDSPSATSPSASETTATIELPESADVNDTTDSTRTIERSPLAKEDSLTLELPNPGFRSPRGLDGFPYDVEMPFASHLRRGPYQCLSPFEVECCDNNDDMKEMSSEDIEIDDLMKKFP